MKDTNRLLLHIKALVWCLHRVCQKYNLEYILSSLKTKTIHPIISNTNLGRNVEFIIENLNDKNIEELIKCLNDVHLRRAKDQAILEDDDEIGYYIKAVKQIGDVPKDSCGVIINKDKDFEVLFWKDPEGLIKRTMSPSAAKIISGTYPM